MQTCKFEKNSDGKWQCKNCNWTIHKPRNRPPVGYKCHNRTPSSPPSSAPTFLKPKRPFVKQSEVTTKIPPKNKEIGDRVEEALTSIGITSARVEQWMGRPCSCKKRKEKLNQLSRYVKRILRGEADMKEHMEDLISEG